MSVPSSFDGLYDGLTVKAECSFPQDCSCGLVYADMEVFLRNTSPVPNGSGLNEMPWYAGGSVGLWRNCSCGSTLVLVCSDRRDQSEEGRSRRHHFGNNLQKLHEQGMSLVEARTMLLEQQRKRSAEK